MEEILKVLNRDTEESMSNKILEPTLKKGIKRYSTKLNFILVWLDEK
jgi:hypothetical protein